MFFSAAEVKMHVEIRSDPIQIDFKFDLLPLLFVLPVTVAPAQQQQSARDDNKKTQSYNTNLCFHNYHACLLLLFVLTAPFPSTTHPTPRTQPPSNLPGPAIMHFSVLPVFFSVLVVALISTTTTATTVPFHVCHDQDALGVDRIDLTPIPAVAGQPLNIIAEGTTDVTIEQGTRVHMSIKLGNLPAPPVEYDLCDSLMDGVDCPIPAGFTSRARFVYNVPRVSPAGRATSTVTTFDKTGNELSCLKLQVDVVRPMAATATGGVVTKPMRAEPSEKIEGEDEAMTWTWTNN